MHIKTLGIDLAKSVFQLHGIDKHHEVVLKKRLSREALVPLIQNLPVCQIFMEACSGAHDWARRFEAMGHRVKLLSPKSVKRFLNGQKNDMNDARAIVSAGLAPDARFVQIKSVEQQTAQSLLRIREGYVTRRTELSNQIRGLLTEYGVVFKQGSRALRAQLTEGLEALEVPPGLKPEIERLWEDWKNTDKRVSALDKTLEQMSDVNEYTGRLKTIPGVGVLSSLALFAAVGNGSAFRNGRHMSAFVGLVPRQHSSGGKERLGSITKQGNTYLRKTLIQGSKAAFYHLGKQEHASKTWVYQLAERRGQNIAAVAQANKNVRMAWALLTKGETYQPQKQAA